MREFYIGERVTLPLKEYDFRDIKHMRPSKSYEVIRERLMRLLKGDRDLVIYFGSCPYERVTVRGGHIICEITVADSRKESEKDADFFYESKNRRRRSVVESRSLNRWILKSGSKNGTE